MFIADEIQSGFCRTGDWFACEHEGVVPDLVTTAKGIAGGLPLAAVTGRAEIMDAVHAGGLGGTYGGNPVACAAALGAIETMAAEDLAGQGPPDRRHHAPPAAQAGRGQPGHRRRPRPRRDDRHRADRAGHAASPTRRPPPQVASGLPRRPAWSCSPAARSATCCASCRRWSSARTCSRRGSASWRTPSARSDGVAGAQPAPAPARPCVRQYAGADKTWREFAHRHHMDGPRDLVFC